MLGFFAVMEKCRVKMFKNMVLRGLFGNKKDSEA
jgi:hypothetical protein